MNDPGAPTAVTVAHASDIDVLGAEVVRVVLRELGLGEEVTGCVVDDDRMVLLLVTAIAEEEDGLEIWDIVVGGMLLLEVGNTVVDVASVLCVLDGRLDTAVLEEIDDV